MVMQTKASEYVFFAVQYIFILTGVVLLAGTVSLSELAGTGIAVSAHTHGITDPVAGAIALFIGLFLPLARQEIHAIEAHKPHRALSIGKHFWQIIQVIAIVVGIFNFARYIT